ncbi:MAG: RHS repeat-associated core domain-containing protein [Firmicutes bacterium]|nr:RHS repeat-associated core domain-containing protein [Bacillota bacterium]
MERRGGAVTGVYSYGNALVARNGEVVLPDGLGTTRATVDSLQALTSTLTTEAFGNTAAQWVSSCNPYRFAGAWGYRDDGDAGLLHVGARYYDPQVGRFISRDAVLSEHPYLYCEHEPVNHVDPSGRCWVAIAAAVVGAALTVWGMYEWSQEIDRARAQGKRRRDSCYSGDNPEHDCTVDGGYLKDLQEKVAKEAKKRYVEAPIEKTLPPTVRLINGLRKLVQKVREAWHNEGDNRPPDRTQ